MKLFLIATLCLFTQLASANDGSTPYIKVTGVVPSAAGTDVAIQVYGKELKQFFDVLPIDFVMVDESRSIWAYSSNWIFGIWCSKSYVRPTTGENRDDYSCNFQVTAIDVLPWSDDYESDSYNAVEDSSTLSQPADKSLNVLGVAPGLAPLGKVFTMYGKDTEGLAKQLIGTGISFKSAAYTVGLNCQKDYVRPTTGQLMSDYMCSLNLTKN